MNSSVACFFHTSWGGLFQDDASFNGRPLRHDEEASDDQDSENNAHHCPLDEYLGEISSLESDREDGGDNSDQDLVRK